MPNLLTFVIGFVVVCAQATAVTRVLESTEQHLHLEISVPRPELTPVRLGGQAFVRVGLAGFETDVAPGYPELPTVTELVAVPEGRRLAVEVEAGPEYPVSLSHPLAFASSRPSHCRPSPPAKVVAVAYQGTYGDSPVEVRETSYASRDQLAVVRFWPLRYDAARNTLRWRPTLRVRFRFLPAQTSASAAPVSRGGVSVARYVALNGERMAATAAGPPVDLIIAHESYRFGLQRLIAMKEHWGREVRVHYVRGQSAQQIREIIRGEYRSASPPASTLLVGNIDQIPAWRGSGDNRWTDYDYQILDNGTLPDVALGRVPAHSLAELLAFVDKVIARETNPRQDDHVLLTAGRDSSMGCAANATQVGQGMEQAAGEKLRLEKRYKTQVDTQAVLDGYNDDPNLVVYDGHGNRQGMTEIPLLISGLDRLRNRVFPLVLDIACLNANWGQGASPRNFAESILLMPNAGAAGILASGGSGYGHDYFRTIGRIMGQVRSELPGSGEMNAIGQVILAAKVKHGSQDRTYWNYYGDPASRVWATGTAPLSQAPSPSRSLPSTEQASVAGTLQNAGG